MILGQTRVGTKEVETNGLNCEDLLMDRRTNGSDCFWISAMSNLGIHVPFCGGLKSVPSGARKELGKRDRWMRTGRSTWKNRKWEELSRRE